MKQNFIKSMVVSSAMSIVLLYLRIQWSGSLFYIFLVWNLFLAWIPYLLSLLLKQEDKEFKSKYVKAVLFCGWLTFFPNSPYILTDLFHLHIRKGIPLWFDLVLILSFAWNGLLLGYASLISVQIFLKRWLSKKAIDCFAVSLMILCSFGIYLGRYPRYNSWDVVTDPVTLFSDILNMLIHPMQNTRMIGVTFFFSIFLMISFRTLTTLIKENKNE